MWIRLACGVVAGRLRQQKRCWRPLEATCLTSCPLWCPFDPAQNKEEERARVDKELANIRGKFRADRQLSSYEKKKYVTKMLYIYMLGYDVDFGHMEAVGLISAPKFSEKQVGTAERAR